MAKPVAGDQVAERAKLAALASPPQLAQFLQETTPEVLIALARNPHLQEGDLLRLLERRDLPQEVIRELAVHPETTRNYSVKLALARHPQTPRQVSLPLMKFLYLFDLVRLCEAPGVPSDVKRVAEGTILKRGETVPRGEKIALARRGPARVAAGLLLTDDPELIRAALDNPYLSEAELLRVLGQEELPAVAVEAIAHHGKWSRRYHLRLALIRNPLTPLSCVLAFLPDLTVGDLRDICRDQRMPEEVRRYVLAHCAGRLKKGPRTPHATSEAE